MDRPTQSLRKVRKQGEVARTETASNFYGQRRGWTAGNVMLSKYRELSWVFPSRLHRSSVVIFKFNLKIEFIALDVFCFLLASLPFQSKTFLFQFWFYRKNSHISWYLNEYWFLLRKYKNKYIIIAIIQCTQIKVLMLSLYLTLSCII